MLTVCILVNGNPLMARSATNTGRVCKLGKHIYDVDDGSRIYHRQEDGAVALAIKMLKTIKEKP